MSQFKKVRHNQPLQLTTFYLHSIHKNIHLNKKCFSFAAAAVIIRYKSCLCAEVDFSVFLMHNILLKLVIQGHIFLIFCLSLRYSFYLAIHGLFLFISFFFK